MAAHDFAARIAICTAAKSTLGKQPAAMAVFLHLEGGMVWRWLKPWLEHHGYDKPGANDLRRVPSRHYSGWDKASAEGMHCTLGQPQPRGYAPFNPNQHAPDFRT